MKKNILAILTVILLVAQAAAQFTSITRCGTSGIGHAVCFVNTDTGFVAGEAYGKGVIQRTMDGGNTWSNVYTSTLNFEWVRDIFFVSASTGIAVGVSGTILKTVDGGTTWSYQTTSGVTEFSAVHFPTSMVGYAVGDGSIYKTIDGGTTWTPQVSGATGYLNDVFFVDANTGYAVGVNDVLKTVNGGTTWSAVTGSLGNTYERLSVFCTDANTCHISQIFEMKKTTDGGATWTTPVLPALTSPFGYCLTSSHFTNSLTGYAVGARADTSGGSFNPIVGVIFSTIDAGQTWNNINTSLNNDSLQSKWLMDVSFVNSQVGYTTGDVGIMLKTINAGGLITGLASESKNESQIYPNPFAISTIIQTNEMLKNATLSLYNSNGQLLRVEKNISGQTVTLQRENLTSGLYYIRLIQDGKVVTSERLMIVDIGAD